MITEVIQYFDDSTMNQLASVISEGTWFNEDTPSFKGTNQSKPHLMKKKNERLRINYDENINVVHYLWQQICSMNAIHIRSIEIRKCTEDDCVWDTFKSVKNFWTEDRYISKFLILRLTANNKHTIGWMWAWDPLYDKAMPAFYSSDLKLITSGRKWELQMQNFVRRIANTYYS